MKRGKPLRRTPLKRGKPLPRGSTHLSRVTPIKKVNKAHRKALRLKQFGGPGEQGDVCRKLPCAACGAPPPSDPAHVLSRGAGGGHFANIIPLCRPCHSLQHSIGIPAFEAKYGIDMEAIAKEISESME